MINIKQEAYLPLSFRMGGYFLVILGLLRLVSTIVIDFSLMAALLGLVLILVGAILITAHYRLEINVSDRTYHDYVWLLSAKTGSVTSFSYVHKIYINQLKQKTGYHSRSGRRFESSDVIYKAFMKLDNGEKVHMDTDVNEEELDKRVKKIIAQLGDLYKPEL